MKTWEYNGVLKLNKEVDGGGWSIEYDSTDDSPKPYKLYEIPQYGGKPQLEQEFRDIVDAIAYAEAMFT